MGKKLLKIFGILAIIFLGLLVVLFMAGLMAKPDFKGESAVSYQASPVAIFDWLTNIQDYENRRKEVTKVEITGNNPYGLPKWKEYADMGGYLEFEAIKLVRPTNLTISLFGGTIGMKGTWEYNLVSNEEGTLVTIKEDSSISSAMVRAMYWLSGRDWALRKEHETLAKAFAAP